MIDEDVVRPIMRSAKVTDCVSKDIRVHKGALLLIDLCNSLKNIGPSSSDIDPLLQSVENSHFFAAKCSP